MDYQHILVATDFSDIGKQACIKAGELAKLLEAHLTVLHIIEHYPEDRSENAIPPENEDPRSFFIKQAETELDGLSNELDLQDISTDVVLSSQSAGREISHYATEKEVDLIVTGTHGEEGFLQRLGSTANTVLHDANRDVLIVRGND